MHLEPDGKTAFRPPACLICGGKPTVKSHLLPRAFAHDARGQQKNLLIGRAGKKGYSFTQSGEVDKTILCHKHEAAIGPYDRYAVAFVRGWRSRFHRATELGGIVGEVDPETLVRFAASVIWRHSVSRLAPGVDVGDYEATLRRVVFEDAPVAKEPATLVYSFFDDLLDQPTLDRLVLPPAEAIMDNYKAFGFLIGGLGFLVKTDERPLSPTEELFVANGRTNIFCSLRPQRGSPEFEGIAKMLVDMNQVSAAR